MTGYCVMPWVGMEVNNNGNLRPCCAWAEESVLDENGDKYNINTHAISEYQNSDKLKDVQQRILAGDRIAECSKCFHEESVGVRSMRIRKNAQFPTDVETEIGYKSIDMKISNLCNQKCMICNATASSMIAAENKQLFPELMQGFNYDEFNWYQNDDRWNELKALAHDVHHLDFYGGEPWLIKKQWEFIAYLVETGLSSHISLNYATNGSVFNDKWFTDYFANFKNVTILLSADGIGDTFEYVRYPAKWNVFAENIQKIIDYRDQGIIEWVGIAYTVSAFSMHNVIDSLKYYKEINVPVWFNLVNEGEFSAGVLSADAKELLWQTIEDGWQDDFLLSDQIGPEFFKAALDCDIEQKWKDLFKFKTAARDHHRDNSFAAIFPDTKE